MNKAQALTIVGALPDNADIELTITSVVGEDPSIPENPGEGEEGKEVEMILITGDRVRVLPKPDNNAKEIGYLRKDESAQAGEWKKIGSMEYVQVYVGGFGRFDQDVAWLRWNEDKMSVYLKEV